MDCLVPGIGEIIGGSQREDNYDTLLNRMNELGLKPEGLSVLSRPAQIRLHPPRGLRPRLRTLRHVPDRHLEHPRRAPLPAHRRQLRPNGECNRKLFNAQRRACPRCAAPFSLQYTKYSCGKTACPARKFLAVGHAPPVFRYTLSRFFCFMQEEAVFLFPLRRGWADRVVRPSFTADCAVQKSLCREQKVHRGFFHLAQRRHFSAQIPTQFRPSSQNLSNCAKSACFFLPSTL